MCRESRNAIWVKYLWRSERPHYRTPVVQSVRSAICSFRYSNRKCMWRAAHQKILARVTCSVVEDHIDQCTEIDTKIRLLPSNVADEERMNMRICMYAGIFVHDQKKRYLQQQQHIGWLQINCIYSITPQRNKLQFLGITMKIFLAVGKAELYTQCQVSLKKKIMQKPNVSKNTSLKSLHWMSLEDLAFYVQSYIRIANDRSKVVFECFSESF